MSDGPFPDLEFFERRIAVLDGDRAFTGAELATSAGAVAAALRKRGLPPGSRIAALLPNGPQAVAAFLAVAYSGHVWLPLNAGSKAAEVQAVIRRAGVRAVLCLRRTATGFDDDAAPLAVDGLPDGPGAEACGGMPAWCERDEDREFVCLSTSGSSGEPRLISRSLGAVRANTRQVAAALDVTSADRFLAVVPFWHANGFSNCLLTPLARGASVVTVRRFLPRPALETIEASGVSVVIASPFVFKAFAQFLSANPEMARGLGSVRAWVSSGAALPPAIDRSLAELGLPVRQLYGSSETGTLCLSGPGPLEPGCVGRPIPGVEVRLVDDDGAVVRAGEAGAVEVRSAALFDGYIADASRRPARSAEGFYAMGDIARWSDDGELLLMGRSDAMINVAGVKVDPREVKAVLESMPEIGQALVHGRTDAAGMQQIRALLVAEREIPAEEVLAYCRQRLAEYKLPRILEFVDEIPQDLMGKTPRRLLEN